MKIIKRQTTYVVTVGETNEMASETIPNQALSPKELLELYGRGQPMPQTFFDEENDWNVQGMDLTEIDMLRDHLMSQQKQAKETLGNIEKYRLELIKKKEQLTEENTNLEEA